MVGSLHYCFVHSCHRRLSILGNYSKIMHFLIHTNNSLQFFFYGHEEFLEDIAFVIFAFFNVIWATLYLESWKRRSAELAYSWGTADQRDELLAEPRPEFKGTEIISEITGKPELYYPSWKRNLFRYFVTVPVIGFCLVIVFASVFIILELQQWWDIVIKEKGYVSFLSYGPKVLLAIVIPILDSVYNNIAIWLNNKGKFCRKLLRFFPFLKTRQLQRNIESNIFRKL